MALSVPTLTPSCRPISYHLTRVSFNFSTTTGKSSTPRCLTAENETSQWIVKNRNLAKSAYPILLVQFSIQANERSPCNVLRVANEANSSQGVDWNMEWNGGMESECTQL